MSGHSKWKQIKRGKAKTDSQRAKVFTKMARFIAVAARKGASPDMNAELRMAIERAKYEDMPRENIERAIKKGAGGEVGTELENAEYEVFGPRGTMFVVKALTDNKNRTVGEIKNILSKHNGRLGEIGSVKWIFDHFGLIALESGDKKKNERLELAAIEAGAEDVREKENALEIYTAPENFDKVLKLLQGGGNKIISASIDWIAKNPIKVEDAKALEEVKGLLNVLDEQDDVEEIYSNIENL
ncbi:YebC/PmpR family DNA-binding transcriptional regulator [Patescibacteria group bacterium]|nr:YebC/PmpR family DNA-binding transcriptional regulator [Patescibacteria group bacterium]MBU4579832.1 YebC/PmpR family DNA-binding transcriptional regulator [Patescibacteria group bacterium]